jgi:hypothetical protein
MRQIGARQEAGRIGGIGSCGRELCCSTWITNFSSVTTNSARHQEISLNPQKLAGQCGKLKCCLNYELDTYIDAQKDFPRIHEPLQLFDGQAYLQKTDILKRIMWFSSAPDSSMNLTEVSVDRVKEILALNRKGQKADKLLGEISEENIAKAKLMLEPDFKNVVGEDSITRFDPSRKRSGGSSRNRGRGRGGNASQGNDAAPTSTNSRQPQGQPSPNRGNRTPQERPERRPDQNRTGGQRPARGERVERAEPRTDRTEPRTERPSRSESPRPEQAPRSEKAPRAESGQRAERNQRVENRRRPAGNPNREGGNREGAGSAGASREPKPRPSRGPRPKKEGEGSSNPE